jgi:hypothetical protein
LRLCHADPQTKNEDNKDAILYDYLFSYAVSGKLDKDFGDRYMDDRVEMLRASDVAKFMESVIKVGMLTSENENECAKLIRENRKLIFAKFI